MNYLKTIFSDDSDFEDLKLIGSAATGTMRKGSGDLDFFIIFSNEKDILKFDKKMRSTNLDITKTKIEEAYGYIKVSGKFNNYNFVVVPIKNPCGKIDSYVSDAFYHPEFILKNRSDNHIEHTILAKEFFDKTGLYEKIRGISCELMIIKYGSIDNLINAIANSESIRVNFSNNHETYSSDPIIVDYPYIGGRSISKSITREDYSKIQILARKILADPANLLRDEFRMTI